MYTYRLLFSLIFVLLVAACDTDNESTPEEVEAYTVIEEAELSPDDEIAEPAEDVILTISGLIRNTNVGDTLQLDMATLEQLEVIEYSVDDKQAEGRVATFQGVLLSDVLELAGIDSEATTLNTVALNDYSVEIPLEDADSYPVMIATQVEGERMSIERYGPIRVIYPNESYEFNDTEYDQRWIWQLVSIEVR